MKKTRRSMALLGLLSAEVTTSDMCRVPVPGRASSRARHYCRPLHKLWAATLPVGADVDAAAAFLLTWRR